MLSVALFPAYRQLIEDIFLNHHLVDEDADFYGAFVNGDDLEHEKWRDYEADIASVLSHNQ